MVSGATDIELFRYGIKATNPLFYSIDDLEIILDFSMTITSPMIGFSNPTNILSGSVRITNISEEIIFDNTDLNINNSIFAVDIDNQPDSDQIETIANAILQMGKLPNGQYEINIGMSYNGVDQDSEISETIEIYFPVVLELITPVEVA